MKLTYVIPHGIYGGGKSGIEKGVQNKLDAQIKSLQDNGIDVNPIYLPLAFTTPLALIRSYKDAFQTMSRLYSGNSDEYIYVRALIPHTINYLLSYNKTRVAKIIYEMQDTGIYILKNQSLFRKLQVLYLNTMERLFSKRIVKCSSAVVSVTREISEHYKHKTNSSSTRHLVLGNGIETNRYSPHVPPRMEQELHVICVANVHPWHGLDRFIRGIYDYKSLDNGIQIFFHIVGNGPDISHLMNLASLLNLKDNVIFHGFKSGNELDEIFDLCHIALSSLGGFRRGMHESSTLKSREYCARGIPFIMALKDADFPENWEYTQMVPADETSIDMNTVVNFANRVMADSEHPQKMRKYAEKNIDWMAKMKVLKEFLESL